jgi:hypothetical protein
MAVVLRMGNRDVVVACAGKVLKLMFHVSHGSLGRQQLHNMMGCLPMIRTGIPTAFGLRPKCSCGLIGVQPIVGGVPQR